MLAAITHLGITGSVNHGVGPEAEAHGQVEGGREAIGDGKGQVGAPLEICGFEAAGSGFVWTVGGLGLSPGLK